MPVLQLILISKFSLLQDFGYNYCIYDMLFCEALCFLTGAFRLSINLCVICLLKPHH